MIKEKTKGKGVWRIKQYRGGKLILDEVIHNTVTTVGFNYMLNAAFTTGSQIGTWFAGLVNNVGFTGELIGDTSASHAGWAEFTGYSESVRQTWPPDAVASAAIQNTTTDMTFTINAGGAIIGMFLISVNTKGGTSGTLWSMCERGAGALTVVNGDVLKISYGYSLV